MVLQQDNICKYNQKGYCKFGSRCEKEHNNEICTNLLDCKDENCGKRHPKVCRNYQKQGTCFFKEECAYQQHVQKSQGEHLFLVQILASHFKEVGVLKQELNDLKLKVEVMETKMSTVSKNVHADEDTKETEEETMKESKKPEEEASKIQPQCDVCEYQCEKEITLKRHKNTKHQRVKTIKYPSDATEEKSTPFYCDECEYSCKTKKNLKKHKAQDHKDLVESKIFKCENCGKEFSKKEELEVHMKENHPLCQCTADSVCDDCLEEWVDKPRN